MLEAIAKRKIGVSERTELLLERVEYKQAHTASELDAIHRLRYEAYVKEGAVPLRQDRRLLDAFDDGDNLMNFGIFVDGQLSGSVRIHRLSSVGHVSPALEAFGDVLNPLLEQGKTIIDTNRLIVDFEASRQNPELVLATVRLAVMAIMHFAPDVSTATVRLEHQAFYRRTFFATQVCPPRFYPTLTKPISLMFMDMIANQERIYARSPYYRSSAAEREALFGPAPLVSREDRSSMAKVDA